MTRFGKLAIGFSGVISCVGVHAQTSVTLYGTVDAGIEYLTNASKTRNSLVREQSGNLWGDRWGLAIKEDLGGGWHALAQLENGFLINTGAAGQGGREFGRRAFVGLSKDGTSIQLGRQLTPMYQVLTKYDPEGLAQYSLAGHDQGFVARDDNAVQLTQKYGNWSATAYYSFGYDSLAAPYGGTTGTIGNSKDLSFSLAYESKLFGAAAVYENTHGPLDSTSAGIGSVASSIAPQRSVAADRAERYLGVVRLSLPSNDVFAGYRYLRTTLHAGMTTVRNVNTVFLGDRFELSPSWFVIPAVYHSQLSGVDAKPTSAVLALDYLLSKRTDIYLNTSYVWNTRLSTVAVNVGDSTLAGVNQFGAQLGMRVKF